MGFVCNQCPNRCGVDRTQSVGLCRVGYDAIVSRVALHPWEEPILSGTNGSGTIFFAGCNLGCVFCQNYAISHSNYGHRYTVDALIQAMQSLEQQGAHNINFVNPSHYAHILRQVLARYKPRIPVVYNTSAYDSVDTLRTLEGLVDIYLPDCKYADPNLAARYSHRSDYPTVAMAAIAEMVSQRPQLVYSKDGLLQSGVIIRHLVLPEASQDSVQVLTKLYNMYGNSVYYSVMSQYTPYGDAAQYPEINRKIKPLEYKRAVAALQRAGAVNVFVQDCEAATDAYIPPFTGD